MVTEYDLAKAQNRLDAMNAPYGEPPINGGLVNISYNIGRENFSKPAEKTSFKKQVVEFGAIAVFGAALAVPFLASSGAFTEGEAIKARQSLLGRSDAPTIASRIMDKFNQPASDHDSNNNDAVATAELVVNKSNTKFTFYTN